MGTQAADHRSAADPARRWRSIGLALAGLVALGAAFGFGYLVGEARLLRGELVGELLWRHLFRLSETELFNRAMSWRLAEENLHLSQKVRATEAQVTEVERGASACRAQQDFLREEFALILAQRNSCLAIQESN